MIDEVKNFEEDKTKSLVENSDDLEEGVEMENLSVNWSKIVSVQENLLLGVSVMSAVPVRQEAVKLALTSSTNFFIGIAWLVFMVVPCAMIGPLIVSIPAHSSLVRATWRTQGCAIFTVIGSILLYRVKKGQMNFYEDHKPSKIMRTAFSSIFFFTWTVGLILGFAMSISSHAHILYSSTGVYVLLFSLLSWKLVHRYEIIGYILFLGGLTVMLSDPFAHKTKGEGKPWIGNLWAFLGAGFGGVLAILNQKNTQLIHPFVLVTHYFVFSVILQLIVFPLLEDNPLFYSFDPQFGAFGWMTDLRVILYLDGIVVPFTGVLANVALIFAFIYWPIEIIWIAGLLEPFIAQIGGIILGQDEVPGMMTLYGILIISLGLILATYGAKLKTAIQSKYLLD